MGGGWSGLAQEIQPATVIINPKTGRAHADPFDRMLVAQALAEPMRLVTADPLVALHGVDAPGLIEKIPA